MLHQSIAIAYRIHVTKVTRHIPDLHSSLFNKINS